MSRAAPDVKSVFGRAVEIPSDADRAAYLDEACAAAPEVRAEVQGLLDALGKAGSFMRSPAASPPNTDAYEPPITEHEGTVIGPYVLREQIGEGGFGLVFVAEQQQPVRRKVALKVIKPGMDTRAVVARFEAERQALAMMDHPNIAKVLDAGSTEAGRPYFVMELVKGVPITEYADANNLTPRDRLGLFLQVCRAVQHAHQKGVIHRDLKPSNILVAPHDGMPVVKVIDFGVAKALGQQLTDKTIYTRFAQMIGTPLYMSPEQAEVNQLDVDTRSDIYSLGVLLYELLTGTTPFDRDRFRKAAFDEIRRIIKEEEPPRPSTRLSSLGATLTAVSAMRGTDPGRLAGVLRGELDWVVMKCLEKDRSRRFDTASALAKDVERFLKDEPVEARPPSAWYRLRKAARRNRTALTVAGVVAATILVGTAATLWQASLARTDRERAERADRERIEADTIASAKLREQEELRVAERRQEKLDRAIEASFSSAPVKAHDAIVEAEKVGVAADRVRWLRGLVHHQQSQYVDAIREYDASIALKPSVAAIATRRRAIFEAYLETGKKLGPVVEPDTWLVSMQPETAEDYLCRGYWTTLFGGPQTLSDLDRAIDMRDSPVARAIRGQALSFFAWDTGDDALRDRALDDLRLAKLRLSDSTFVRVFSLYTQMTAAIRYGKNGQIKERKTALEEAEQDANALKNASGFGYVISRSRYFESIDDDEAAFAILDRAMRRPETVGVAAHYALRLYEKGRDAESLSVLDKWLPPGNVAGQMLRIILQADQPEIGRDKAFDLYREQVAARKDAVDALEVSLYEVPILVLLGKRKEAEDALRSNPLPYSRPENQYLTRDLSEEGLLDSASKSQARACIAHFTIGVVRLSEGDRDAAREHFRKTLDTGWGWGHASRTHARAFLARMDRDPTWPKWIPVTSAAGDKQKQRAATRPVISEEVAPLEALAPIAKDGHKGVGFLRKPTGKGPFPAIVLLHGGFGGFPAEQVKSIALDTWASRYLAAGYVVATITYRKRDADPQSAEAVEDVLAVIEQLRKLPYVDPKSVVLNGTSGGGDLALSVAAATDLAAIVPEEPAAFMFTGILNKQLPKEGGVFTIMNTEPIRADPEKYYTPECQKLTRERIARIKCPILIIQGDLARIGAGERSITGVNQFNAKVTIPELRKAGKTLEVKTYKGESHSFAFGSPFRQGPPPPAAYQAFEDVNAFLQKHLPTKPTPMDPSLVKQVPFEAK